MGGPALFGNGGDRLRLKGSSKKGSEKNNFSLVQRKAHGWNAASVDGGNRGKMRTRIFSAYREELPKTVRSGPPLEKESRGARGKLSY